MEYNVVRRSELKRLDRREIREVALEKLRERMEKGYNPARPLVVVEENGDRLVADGNHRLIVAEELGIEELPCLIREGDPYRIGVRANADDEAATPDDLFDFLDLIQQLKEEGRKQREIAEVLGWSENQVKRFSVLLSKIVPRVLYLAKQYQKGRGTGKVPNGTFNFTEGWFRDSGLYDLSEKYQWDVMEAFVKAKCKWDKRKLKQETAKRRKWMQWIESARKELRKPDDLKNLTEEIESGKIRNENHLRRKIESLNKGAWEEENIQYEFVDAESYLDRLDERADCVIADPPYGIDFTSPRYRNADFDPIEGDDGLEVAVKFLRKLPDIMKEDSHAYVFTRWDVYPLLHPHIPDELELANLLIWYKGKGGHGMGDLENYAPSYEMILFLKKGDRPLEGKRDSDFLDTVEFRDIRFSGEEKYHPAQKPLELISFLIDKSTVEGEIVLDPFMGSGTTAAAAAKAGRAFRGCEVDETYREVVDQRVRDVLQ